MGVRVRGWLVSAQWRKGGRAHRSARLHAPRTCLVPAGALGRTHYAAGVARAHTHTHTRAGATRRPLLVAAPRRRLAASAAAPLRREAATLPRRAPRSPRAPAPLLRRPTRCPPARPTRCWSRPRFSRATTSLLRQPQGRPSTPCGRGVADSGEAHACTARHAHAHARPDTRSARPAAPRPCCPSLCAYSLTDCPAVPKGSRACQTRLESSRPRAGPTSLPPP